MTRCDAAHDGHDCEQRGACTKALIALCERVAHREREGDRERDALREMLQ